METSSFFNLLDYVIIAIMLSSSCFGFIRGFTKDFFSTCAWFGSGFIASLAAPSMTIHCTRYISDPTLARPAAIGIVYIFSLMLLLICVGAISKTVKSTILSGVDRSMGLLFGLIRGMLIPLSAAILFIVFEFQQKNYAIIRESKLSPLVFDVSDLFIPQIKKMNLLQKMDSHTYQKLINMKPHDRTNKSSASILMKARIKKQETQASNKKRKQKHHQK